MNDHLPYYYDLSHIFTIDKNKILKTNIQEFIPIEKSKNLYIKKTFDRTLVDDDFKNLIENILEEQISKINLWYWGSSDSNMAHIDCGPNLSERHPFAINYVLNKESSEVHWFDIEENTLLKIQHGDDHVPGLDIQNVTTYIPVDVTNLSPSESWATKELTLLNTSIPHIIRTENFRISVSIQFNPRLKLDTALNRFEKYVSDKC